jgi:hypothetical protein
MGGDLLWPACAAALAGLAVLRWSWSRKARSVAVNTLGGGLLALSALLAGAEAGAWGVSVASLVAMGVAMVLLAFAALRAPRGRATGTERRARILPDAGEPLQLGRRALAFVEVVIGGFAASIALGIATRALGLLVGWSEADAVAAAFFVVPIAWGILACVLLMQQAHRARWITLGLSTLPVVPALLAGS